MHSWRRTLVLIGTLRFITPFFIFFAPLLTAGTSLLLDGIDAGVGYRAKIKWKTYTLYDKLLDYWWYIFIFVFCIHLPIFPVILVLFIIRSIGHFLVLLTGDERYFVYFPNILEIYFIFYLISSVFNSLSILFIGTNQIIPLIIAAMIVLPREYAVHIKKIAPLMNKSYIKWHKGKK